MKVIFIVLKEAEARKIIFDLIDTAADGAELSTRGNGTKKELAKIERKTDQAIQNAWEKLTGQTLKVEDPVSFIYGRD